MEILGILILIGLPLAGYNLFLKDDHLILIVTENDDVKGQLRSKILRTSLLVSFGATLAFHIVTAALGAPALIWALITIPIVFLFNLLALLLVMEFMNRRKVR